MQFYHKVKLNYDGTLQSYDIMIHYSKLILSSVQRVMYQVLFKEDLIVANDKFSSTISFHLKVYQK